MAKTYSLANGVDARDVTTTGHLDADIDIGELVGAEEEDGLVKLRTEDLRGEQLQGSAVDPDEALASHTACDGCSEIRVSDSVLSVILIDFLTSKTREILLTGGILLLAENLDCLGRHFEFAGPGKITTYRFVRRGYWNF